MSKLHILIFLLVLPVLVIGCKTKPTREIVYVEKEVPVNHEPTHEEPTHEEDMEPTPEPVTIEEQRHEEKVEFSESVREADVMEEKDLTGREITYFAVEAKLFDDFDVLKQVRYSIVSACHDNNYKIVDEKNPTRKGFRFKIMSEMGPVSLTETITNALTDYAVRITRKNDNLLLIMPE